VRVIDGILFFWLTWVTWVVATFLFRKSQDRYFVSIVALLSIIFSHTYVASSVFSVNVSLLLFMLVGCFMLVKSTFWQKCYTFIVSSIVMMAYVSMLSIHIFDPVWFLIKIKYVIAILCTLILLLLCRSMKVAVAALFIGINVGEIIFSIIIYNIHYVTFQQPLFALDVISISITSSFIFFTYFSIVNEMQKSSIKSTKRGRALL
jgi:hypothetical protein